MMWTAFPLRHPIVNTLTNLGAQVRCKLPTRSGGGYGLNRETLQKLADKGYKLIVTVDNGISAIEKLTWPQSWALSW